MKTFKSFEDALKPLDKLLDKVEDESLGVISQELYKDSEPFTYRQEGIMYESGMIFSDFDKGIIREKTPYVRKRYFEGGKPSKNMQAQPQWFEVTKKKFIGKYTKMITKIAEGVKNDLY